MKLFLLGCIIFILLVMVIAVMRLRRPQQQATRYRSRKVSENFGTADNEILTDSIVHEDPDVVLGLKKESEVAQTVSQNSRPAYLVLHVMAPEHENYGGYELLQALLANNLRYDAADKLFHAYDEDANSVFFLASVNKPGTFDLPTMSQFYCPGLSLFMVPDDSEDAAADFELMLSTAHQLIEDLGGEIRDEDRKILTGDKIYHLRQQVRSMQLV